MKKILILYTNAHTSNELYGVSMLKGKKNDTFGYRLVLQQGARLSFHCKSV